MMKCFGKHGTGKDCGDCAYARQCMEIEAFDKKIARSNRKYALLKLSYHEAFMRGLDKPAGEILPDGYARI